MNIKQCLAHNTVMLFGKKLFKTLLIFITVLICSFTVSPLSANADTESLYLGGFPAGFTLSTTTVEVVGICDVITSEGLRSPAKECGIRTGDIIDKINGVEVNSTGDINKILSEQYKRFIISVIRNGENLEFEINPVSDRSSGSKKLGILVKDSINGIGTVTYIDGKNKKFASLGHPVSNAVNKMIEINGGTVYGCVIYDVKKGVKGTPGELRGAFESGRVIGSAVLNCGCGIYGNLDDGFNTSKLTKIDKGNIDEVKIGKACIYSTVHGNEVKKYDISIVKTDKNNKDNRNFVIKIEDEELLEISGGIVQGMSGSPIVQNGKLIGAVTHVFVIIRIPTIAKQTFLTQNT